MASGVCWAFRGSSGNGAKSLLLEISVFAEDESYESILMLFALTLYVNVMSTLF